MSIVDRAKDFIGWESTKNNQNKSSLLDVKVTKKTVATIGTMRAGKTTHLAGLGATAQYKASDSAKSDNKFRFLPN
jgi:flagellar biosynthesis GTPase FlhF